MVEQIVAALVVASLSWIGRGLWELRKRPIYAASLTTVPLGMDPEKVVWKGTRQQGRRVVIGFLRREWHYEDDSQHVVLMWREEEPK